MKKIAVVLSGCGVYDGSEIGEAILTLLEIDKQNASYQCFAPDMSQQQVINHLTQKPVDETRNILVEAARIARGKIKPLTEFKADDFDALIFPGGFGAATNLCDFATAGSECKVLPDVITMVQQMHQGAKPVGFICIAPVMIAKLYPAGVRLTIGNDLGTAEKIFAMGAAHINCPVDDVIIDIQNKVVSTPAYMLANRLLEAQRGIAKLVQAIFDLLK